MRPAIACWRATKRTPLVPGALSTLIRTSERAVMRASPWSMSCAATGAADSSTHVSSVRASMPPIMPALDGARQAIFRVVRGCMPSERRERRRRILTLALPIIGAMVSQNVLNLVDTGMVGKLGNQAIAGVGLGSFLNFLLTAFIL